MLGVAQARFLCSWNLASAKRDRIKKKLIYDIISGNDQCYEEKLSRTNRSL